MPDPQPIIPLWLSRAALQVAPELIGCTLVRQFSDYLIRAMIVETEAYEPDDPAMHAYQRQTARNQIMFGASGHAYVYSIYGRYHCLNIVTDQKGIASSVLIRALALETIPPWISAEQALKPARIAAGPGKLCLALKIDSSLNATRLEPGQALWLEHRSALQQQQLTEGRCTLRQTTRIGLTKGVDLPRRWYLAHCPAVSKRG